MNVQFGPPLQQQIAANPQYHEVHDAVAINVERIGADDVFQQSLLVFPEDRPFLELQRSTLRRAVDVEFGCVLAAGQEHGRIAAAIAVERGTPAADEELERAVVDAIDARRHSLLVHNWHIGELLDLGRF